MFSLYPINKVGQIRFCVKILISPFLYFYWLFLGFLIGLIKDHFPEKNVLSFCFMVDGPLYLMLYTMVSVICLFLFFY
jgi:hypothetical protein